MQFIRYYTVQPFEVSLIPQASAFQRASFREYQKNVSGQLGVDLGSSGIDLASIWDRFSIDPGSIWHRSGIDL